MQLAATPDQFTEVLQKLATLSRNHLLFFRLEVGRLTLDTFFGGEGSNYQSTAPNKDLSFSTFATTCAAELAEIGLGEQVLRQCITAHLVVAELPAPTVQVLGFTHIVELSRITDTAARRLLAQATVDNQWTSRQLKDAAFAVKAGKWPDADFATEGLQPPAAPAPSEQPPKTQVGHVLNRFEKAATDLSGLTAQWATVAGPTATDQQTARLRAALQKLHADTAKLLAALPGARADPLVVPPADPPAVA